MRTLDWIILAVSLVFIVLYGVLKGRGNKDIRGFLLAGRSMQWYLVALSIMATQASAITFLSGPGQAYADGMRFVQFYFGLPLAMVILSITAVPIYHKLNVYTAYEYLENRFDLNIRLLASFLFLIQRGLAAGLTIYAPSIILSIILGWNIFWTNLIVGTLVIIYTAYGGTRAVSRTHFYQMLIIMSGMVTAFIIAIRLLPEDVSLLDATYIAGKLGRLNTIDLSFDINNRYNIWSGIIGGLFLQLSYFGTDQSQVQRYLSGSTITQSRMGLIFNGFVKIPMQFFILFIGVIVFVFYQFQLPPLFFNSAAAGAVKQSAAAAEYHALEIRQHQLHDQKQQAIRDYLAARETGIPGLIEEKGTALIASHERYRELRSEATAMIRAQQPDADPSDTNYIFLTFVVGFLPAGVVGLVIAAIIAASMSSTAGELNALASTTVVDFYKRVFARRQNDRREVFVSRLATIVWGVYAIMLAEYASRLGSLIEAVNILGSLFYGTILGIFLTAFYLKKVQGRAVFRAAVVAETAVVATFLFTDVSFLWYNVVGCMGVLLLAPVFQAAQRTQ